jgi:hypothetical protein
MPEAEFAIINMYFTVLFSFTDRSERAALSRHRRMN